MDARQVTSPTIELPTFELVDDIAVLSALQPEWRALLEASANRELMLGPAWVLTWWTQYNADRTLAVGVIRDAGELIGLVPLCRRRIVRRPGIPFRRLELMGASGDEADGVCGEYLGLIARRGRETCVAQAFATALTAGAFGAWDECVLEMVDANGAMTVPLDAAFEGHHVHVAPMGEAYFLPLPSDWETYLQGLHKKRRYWFKKTWKDFEAWVGDSGYSLERARTADELRTGLGILAALHGERWQSDGQSGAFASSRFMAFHEQFAASLLATGQLDLLWLTVGGQPVAVHYSFVHHGKVYFYQSGRKMDVPAGVRLGIVMFIVALQDAMARGLTEYDFLAGDSAYKPFFTQLKRPLVQIRIARSGWRETTLQTLRFGVRGARRLARKVRALKAPRSAVAAGGSPDHAAQKGD